MNTFAVGSVLHEFHVRIDDGQTCKIVIRRHDPYLAAATALATLDYESYADPVVEVLDGPRSKYFRYSEGQLVPVVKIS
jgi:hypothetical protein